MKQKYKDRLIEVKKDLIFFEKQIDELLSDILSSKMADGLTNYCLILAYGTIEDIVKKIIADYFSNKTFPARCQQFSNSLQDNFPLSIKKEGFNRFLKKECSEKWFQELDRRAKDDAYRLIRYKKYNMNDLYAKNTGATDMLATARNDFAHTGKNYTGGIKNILTLYDKSAAWLYEIDDIIATIT